MVIKNQTILTLYENNFPLTTMSRYALLDKIQSPSAIADGVLIYPGGLPTTGIDIEQVAGTARELSVMVISSKMWQLVGDIEIFDTPNGRILSQLKLEDLQFWVRGHIQHGVTGGLRDFLHLSYTPRVSSLSSQLSFRLMNK